MVIYSFLEKYTILFLKYPAGKPEAVFSDVIQSTTSQCSRLYLQFCIQSYFQSCPWLLNKSNKINGRLQKMMEFLVLSFSNRVDYMCVVVDHKCKIQPDSAFCRLYWSLNLKILYFYTVILYSYLIKQSPRAIKCLLTMHTRPL